MKEIADQVHDFVQTRVKIGDIKVESAQDIIEAIIAILSHTITTDEDWVLKIQKNLRTHILTSNQADRLWSDLRANQSTQTTFSNWHQDWAGYHAD